MEEQQTHPAPARIPWWLHIILAILVYSLGKYIIPGMAKDIPFLAPIASLAPLIAPILTIGFLLLGANALYSSSTKENSEDQEQEQDDETG